MVCRGAKPLYVILFPQEWGIIGGWRRFASEPSEWRVGVPQQPQCDTMCLTRRWLGSLGALGSGPHEIAACDVIAIAVLKEDV